MESEDELFHYVELIPPGADWPSPIWPRRCMISPKDKVLAKARLMGFFVLKPSEDKPAPPFAAPEGLTPGSPLT